MVGTQYLEGERLDALRALSIVGSSSEDHLDAVCRIAATLYKAPIALVTLIDDATVWIKARHGVTSVRFRRHDTFCGDTIKLPAGEVLVVPNLLDDERYRDNPFVQGQAGIRFYAGVPLALKSGLNVGTLCVMDTVGRPDFGAKESDELLDLARIVEAHLRLHEARIVRDQDERRYRLLTDNSTDLIIWADLTTVRRYVSPASRWILGFEPEELIGTKPIDFVHPDDREGLKNDLMDVTSGRLKHGTNRHRALRKDGSWVWLEASVSPTFDPDTARPDGYVVSLRDITDRKAVEDELRLSEERLALALDSGSDGLWDWNIVTGEVRLSGQWLRILGYEEDEIPTRIEAWQAQVHPDDSRKTRRHLIEHLRGTTSRLESEYRVRKKCGGYAWTLARGKIVARDANGRALRMVGTHIDMTRRKEAERQVAHMAMHDALTGLPNRTLFRESLEREIQNTERAGNFAVLACDLDRFKIVNDTLGHSAGDVLLKTVAKRLRAALRDGDTVARLGGDEFAIVLSQIDDAQEASLTALRLIKALERPIAIDGHSTRVSISIGIAIGLDDGRDVDNLFKNADIALYRAKAAGRGTYRFYETGMDVQVAERDRLEQDMREAISNGGFSLAYQPVVNLSSGAIVCFEALLRWQHPTRGPIRPIEFIPIAEDTGMIVSLGEWALRTACNEASSWSDDMRVAVNVSAIQFRSPGLEQSVMMALASSGLAPQRLELEITESVLIQDADAVLASLHRLRALGVRIALDDFGTGYSSLSYLRRFPFDKIKIDRTFVGDIANPDTAAIVRAVVGLGMRAGATITAEGVETEEQRERVRQEGCTEMQGYLFSAPVRPSEARGMICRVASVAAA